MKSPEKNKHSCVILDDDPMSVYQLESFLSKIDNLTLIGSFTDPVKAMSAFHDYKMIDFLFIDIGMEVSGLDLARMLKKKVKYIIFVTGYEEFAIKAFEMGDAYLVKPVNLGIIIKTIDNLLCKNLHRNKLSD